MIEDPIMAPLLLTYEDVRQALQCSHSTVKRLVARGELRCVRLGAQTRFRPDDVTAYVNSLAEAAA